MIDSNMTWLWCRGHHSLPFFALVAASLLVASLCGGHDTSIDSIKSGLPRPQLNPQAGFIGCLPPNSSHEGFACRSGPGNSAGRWQQICRTAAGRQRSSRSAASRQLGAGQPGALSCSLGGVAAMGIKNMLRRVRGGSQPEAASSVIPEMGQHAEVKDESEEFDQTPPRTFDADWRCPLSRQPAAGLNAGLLSQLTFHWVGPLMKTGNKKYLEEQDLWERAPQEQMGNLADRFEAAYRAAMDRKPLPPLVPQLFAIPLVRALWGMHHGAFVMTGVLRLVNTFIQFLPALLVSRLLRGLELAAGGGSGAPAAIRQAYVTCVALFVVVSSKTFIENQYFFHKENIGISVRGVTSSAVYRKSLRLSPAARQNATVGEIVNYMQLDAERMETMASSFHSIWDSLLQIFGFSSLLVYYLGPCALAGIAIMVLLIPINTFFFKKLSAIRQRIVRITDSRVKSVSEMLQGIRAIKFYNWEASFRDKVDGLHEKELGESMRSITLKSMLVSILSTTPALVIVVTLGLFSATGNMFRPSTIFTALALFNQLRFPLYFFPNTLSFIADGKVSIDRLSKFLGAEEVVPYVQRVNGVPPPPGLSVAPTNATGGVGVASDAAAATSTTNRGRVYDESIAISVRDGAFYWSDPEAVVQDQPPAIAGPGGQPGGAEGQAPVLRRVKDVVMPALHGCNVEVKKGQLVAVVGTVGSGKSSLLSALLGDMHRVSGEVYAVGRLAYVPQTSWIPNDSLRDNICFGRPYDEQRYRSVIKACRLEKDLELLEFGDQTEIGEQGINLSGGQKQRLSIARAMFADADLYFFDDPLSALDAEVGKEVFEQCIRRALRGKTRVLVTNQLQYLPKVDHIVVMGKIPGVEGSTIVDQGTYQELLARGQDLSKLVEEQRREAQATADAQEEELLRLQEAAKAPGAAGGTRTMEAAAAQVASISGGMVEPAGSLDTRGLDDHPEEQDAPPQRGATPATQGSRPPVDLGAAGSEVPGLTAEASSAVGLAPPSDGGVAQDAGGAAAEKSGGASSKGALMSKEDRAKGAVGWTVYREFIRATGSPLLMASLGVLFFMSNILVQSQQWVVSFWTSDPLYARHSLAFYLTGVTAAAGLVAVFNYVRTVFTYWVGVRAGRKLHRDLLDRVLHAPVAFFDTTPVGRVVQRFSKDVDQIDNAIVSQVAMLINAVMSMVGAVGAIIVATPLFTLGVLPLAKIYVTIMNYFRAVARELKRLDSVTRSPIYAHFGETLGGLTAIRAFGHVGRFAQTNQKLIDNNLASYFALKVTDRWLSIRLEFLGNFVVLVSTLLSTYATQQGRMAPGMAGLALTNALSVTGLLSWAVRSYTETETIMNSVERVLYTSRSTAQEAPHHISRPRHPYYQQLADVTGAAVPDPSTDLGLQSCPDDKLLLKTGWPWQGAIDFRAVTMRYRPETELVLKGVDLHIKPGEKVGIVGRTGSGKSSLLQVLFRMVEASGGEVAIDGVDTHKIGLSALRSRLTIIPQEPVLFSGSLRSNLDPFGTYSDDEIWDALGQAKLAETVRSFANGLEETVAEYGENFSVGQRQLICLARALLRKTRILLLDEATSSVDYETDSVIQSTIRSAFKDCTVLTIAHRLNTIMDSDRILVMDNGRVGEFDKASVLLQNPRSMFSQLLAAERKSIQQGAEPPSADGEGQPPLPPTPINGEHHPHHHHHQDILSKSQGSKVTAEVTPPGPPQ